jgi:putative ABC transport system permease protein
MWLDTLTRNIRYAIRSSTRSPGFSVTVIITLAVGIGANTAVFSTIDAVLLSPIPVPESERLVRVLEFVAAESDQETQIAPIRLEEWASHTAALDALTGYYVEDVSDTSGPLPERIRRAVISPRFLRVWRVTPALGRDFSESDYRAGSTPAVLVSDRYWRTRFGADPNVLTRVVRIEGEPFSIAGVMPASFRFPDRTVDIWWPYSIDGAAMRNTPGNRKHRWYTGIGRLKTGVTLQQAQANLQAIQLTLAKEYPQTDQGIAVRLAPFKQTVIGDIGASLWLLYGAVSVLLLITCINVASLWLSRAARRWNEVSLRFSLGASRAAVALQLLVETALLSTVGAILGLLAGSAASEFIQVLIPNLPRRDEIGLDGRIVAYSMASALIVTLLCGLVPALRSARLASSLAASERTQIGGRHTAQWLMVGVQMALSIALLVGAGLLVRSADALSRVDPGFDPSRVLALRVSANWDEADDRAALVARIDRTLNHLATVPGVEVASTAWSLPGVPRRYQTEFSLAEGRAASEPPVLAEWRSVAPTYFSTLRIPLASGDQCRLPSSSRSETELMVNRVFAERYFRNRTPIGSQLTWESASLRGRIVGIVGNARESGVDRDPPPTVYACDSAPTPFPWFLLRTQSDPATLAATVRSKLGEIEPLRSVYDMAPLDDRIGDAYAQTRARRSLFVAFACAALLLGCLGIYATLTYTVGLRRREIALRLALGARRNELVQQIVWQTMRIVAVASVAGLMISVAVREALAGMLYGVSPSDPLTHAAVVALVVAVTFLAALVPAVRTTAVEPIDALRDY